MPIQPIPSIGGITPWKKTTVEARPTALPKPTGLKTTSITAPWQPSAKVQTNLLPIMPISTTKPWERITRAIRPKQAIKPSDAPAVPSIPTTGDGELSPEALLSRDLYSKIRAPWLLPGREFVNVGIPTTQGAPRQAPLKERADFDSPGGQWAYNVAVVQNLNEFEYGKLAEYAEAKTSYEKGKDVWYKFFNIGLEDNSLENWKKYVSLHHSDVVGKEWGELEKAVKKDFETNELMDIPEFEEFYYLKSDLSSMFLNVEQMFEKKSKKEKIDKIAETLQKLVEETYAPLVREVGAQGAVLPEYLSKMEQEWGRDSEGRLRLKKDIPKPQKKKASMPRLAAPETREVSRAKELESWKTAKAESERILAARPKARAKEYTPKISRWLRGEYTSQEDIDEAVLAGAHR